jgi:hypothetical protein
MKLSQIVRVANTRQAAKITTAEELAKAIEAVIKKHFPKSTIMVQAKSSLGKQVISMFFAVAGSKSETVNSIWENDISLTKAFVYGVNDDGTLQDKLEFKPVMGGSITSKPTEKHMAQGRIKVGLRKKKGTPEQIVKHLDTYFGKLLKTLKANSDQIMDRHKEPLKSIQL